MAITAKPLFESTQLGTSASTLYTAPASTKTIIDKFTVTNTDSSARTVTIHLVPSAGSASTANKIVDALSVAANTSVEIEQLKNHILAAGGFISALASSAAVVNARASGREIT